MCDIIFEKTKGVNRQKGSLKKVLWEISQNPQGSMCQNLLFNKVDLCLSAASLKTRL